MQELITFIATSLVDNPDDVQVTVTEEDDTILVDLAVSKDDLGKVIGKQGRTARAMRSLLSAVAGKEDKMSRLNILE
ncbi:MAG: KH domain-containing protein [Desulfocapsa sp.]|uniref:RNA-binding protein KhpA n=1 Tax=Desulfotalea psychrophila TaxID=84980 RepID=A0ABS3AXT5_9BACT|nr:KH domain-containing protein [Desulfocapsa sp.]MBN4068816.1 KH domain-containing protein [Desulfotalea psychrophila]